MSDVHAEIRALVTSEPIVLFMKGTRAQPQCGFSARVVDVLDELVADYVTRDVMSDPALREGIKTFSDWPTLPQLYVQGKLVGGADIVTEMHASGELAALIRAAVPDASAPGDVQPEILVSEAAIQAFSRFAETTKPEVRLAIDRDFDVVLELEEPRPGDLVIDLGGLLLSMDRRTAQRANGVTIDFVEKANGFKIDNPNKPATVRPLSVEDYAAMRQSGKPHLLLDVRTPAEREIARIEGSELLDDEMMERLMELERTTPIVCQCHHGVRSQNAAQQLVAIGFREVYNLSGGIAAWSQRVDPKVPAY
ncbi:MAG: Grx4 family monothiol glutaredoxin [Sandaracinaceae bacterium]|nr:Grx4 family monothiol glutaredoxin [Sandaracinaceae bacterium]